MVALNIVGPTGPGRSTQNNPQRTVNMFVQQSPGGRSEFQLLPTPGLTSFATYSGADRGAIEFLGEIYQVSGTSLISLSSSGTRTVRGAVPGSGRCIFAIAWDDSINGYGLSIATDGSRYYYDQSTVSLISDVDLTTGNSVAAMNDILIFDNEDGVLTHSVFGEPTNVNAFYAETNTSPDGLQRSAVMNQIAYAMGQRNIELWAYNGATTEFIFTRQEQATINVGLAAIYSVAIDKDYMYFLGSDRQFYRLKSAYAEPVSSPDIVNATEGFDTYDDAIGNCYQQDGQYFYEVTFPTEDRSFLFNCSNGSWTEVSSGVSGGRHAITSIVNAFGKNYALGEDGNAYLLDKAAYSDAGSTIVRERITATVHSGLYGSPGKRIFFKELELICEVGVGLTTGQGVDPVVMMSYSDDGGKTWSAELWGQMGALGDYHYRVRWHQLGSAYNRVFKFRVSDPVFVCFHSANMEIEVGL